LKIGNVVEQVQSGMKKKKMLTATATQDNCPACVTNANELNALAVALSRLLPPCSYDISWAFTEIEFCVQKMNRGTFVVQVVTFN
jgi:hypothetical protein